MILPYLVEKFVVSQKNLINLEEFDKSLVTYDLKELNGKNTNSLSKPQHTRRLKQQQGIKQYKTKLPREGPDGYVHCSIPPNFSGRADKSIDQVVHKNRKKNGTLPK